MNRRATRVVNGTADDDPSAHKMISSRKKIPKTIPGTKSAVNSMLLFHFSPPNNLYILADINPAGVPRNTNSTWKTNISQYENSL
jgi:hypothetical protein